MEKIKTLFLTANPSDSQPLRLQDEIREILEKIRASDYRDSLDIIQRQAVRPNDLLQHFNEHTPHIVHFSGHGSTSEEIVPDFSVVLFRPNFMLASAKHPMKVHKNQGLSNLLSPTDILCGATNQGTHPRSWGADALAVT